MFAQLLNIKQTKYTMRTGVDLDTDFDFSSTHQTQSNKCQCQIKQGNEKWSWSAILTIKPFDTYTSLILPFPLRKTICLNHPFILVIVIYSWWILIAWWSNEHHESKNKTCTIKWPNFHQPKNKTVLRDKFRIRFSIQKCRHYLCVVLFFKRKTAHTFQFK